MSTLNSDLYPSAWVDQSKKQDNMIVIPQVITKFVVKLPSRQIVHFTQQVVYLAHANMPYQSFISIFWLPDYCKQVL